MNTQTPTSKPNDADKLLAFRQALQQARDTIAQLMQENAALKEKPPVALVGMACRFPGGADTLEKFWALLCEQRDAISEVSDSRWSAKAFYAQDRDAPGKMYTTKAGFLTGDIAQFDAAVFGISPKEATALDPQQRLLLEVTWHALEHAGIVPSSLKGSRTGVFVGMSSDDYARVHRHCGSPDVIDAYSITGTTMSTAAGRIAYTLGLHGPCLTLDTACSSSLVALHLALQSLRLGECDTAIVAGVNLILMPELHIAFSKLQALSPDGACRTFDASANGYVRSEGCAVIVLRRQADAVAHRDVIHAIIKGCAINQDGKTAGLAAPNGQAQRAVIQAALKDAGLSPNDIDYVEAHGTGTNLGDPIELEALGDAMQGARENALLVGSVKSNIGHMEPVAGLGGLIKIALSLRHEILPGNLHFNTPNPHVDWDHLGIDVVSRLTPWPVRTKRRHAGLSAFGFSGTNAHVIISEAVALEDNRAVGALGALGAIDAPVATDAKPALSALDRGTHALVLSARTDRSLEGLARAYATHLSEQQATLADVCFTAPCTRESFDQQLVVIAANSQEMIEALIAVADRQSSARAIRYQRGTAPPVAWLFTGQGAQYVGMGATLYRTSPVFKQAIDDCAHELNDFLDQPLTDVLFAPDKNNRIDQTINTQPALFALGYALAQLWLSWGVKPDALVGHSVGEFAAACVAGVFSLPDASKLISARARLMQALPAGGAMAAVFTHETHVQETIQALGLGEAISIACVNQPNEVVVSGTDIAVEQLLATLSKQQITSKALVVSHAFHSAHMQAMLDDFEQVARGVTLSRPTITLLSNLTGQPVGDEILSAQYWCDHVRQTVRFSDSTQYLLASGFTTFLEIGPHPVLATHVKSCAPDPSKLVIVSSLRKARDEWATMGQALQGLLSASVPIDWQAWDAPYARERVGLPCYVFDRQRFWHDQGHRAALSHIARPSQIPPAASLAYEICWESWQAQAKQANSHQRWLLVGTSTEPLEQALLASGHQVECVNTLTDPALLRHAENPTLSGIVMLPGDDSLPAVADSLSALTALAQHMATHDSRAALWVLGDPSRPMGVAAYRGALKSICLEHSFSVGGVIECEHTALASAITILTVDTTEDWFLINGDDIKVARLKPAELPRDHWSVTNNATYLISGGLGGLGLALAAGLAALGAKQLLLLGRRAPDAEQSAAIKAIKHAGTQVLTRTCDVSQPDDIADLKTYLSELDLPLKGIFHLAGVMPAATEGIVPVSDFADALAGKRAGAWALHEATERLQLDAFVMFGSVSAVTGTPGIAAYAAANATLGELAQHREQRGLPATCVHWGPWQLGAMMTDRAQAQSEQSGFRALDKDTGLAQLWRLMSAPSSQALVVDADWNRVSNVFGMRRVQRLLDNLVQPPSSADRHHDMAANARSPEMQALLSLNPTERAQSLSRSLQSILSSVLSLPPHRSPDPSQGFFDMGMDSLTAFEFRESLQSLTGLPIAAPIVFDYPSIDAMTTYLLQALAPSDETEHTTVTANPSHVAAVSDIDVSQLSDEEIARLIEREFDAFDSKGD